MYFCEIKFVDIEMCFLWIPINKIPYITKLQY